MSRNRIFALFGLVGFSLLSATASAGVVIDVGIASLIENKPNQTIALTVSGGDVVQGLNFNLQVADGGPDEGGSIAGPAITAVDIIGAGTIFADNNTGQNDDSLNSPQLFVTSTTTSMGTVAADGTLAFVTFDTTGFFAGSTFTLLLKDTLNGATDFAGIPATITNGTLAITAIPEPSAMLYVGMIAAMVGAGVRLTRRR